MLNSICCEIHDKNSSMSDKLAPYKCMYLNRRTMHLWKTGLHLAEETVQRPADLLSFHHSSQFLNVNLRLFARILYRSRIIKVKVF